MQPAPPPPLRLHWMPVEPSWLVATGIVVLASLPHQVPEYGRRVLRTHLGAMMFAAASTAVFFLKPILGVAMILLLASLLIKQESETFVAQILIKDKARANRWYQEDVMMEEPQMIQERTSDHGFTVDEVTDQDAKPWFGEAAMDETPKAIQERSVGVSDPSVTEYDRGGRASLQ